VSPSRPGDGARAGGGAPAARTAAVHADTRPRADVEREVFLAGLAAGLGSASKVLRLFLQSGILGLGAWLVIKGQVSAGTIIAGSIIMSRALAPIEAAITHWRSFVAAR